MLEEAIAILDGRTQPKPTLTVELARMVNTVVRSLPDDMHMDVLYWGVSCRSKQISEEWHALMKSLTHIQRGALTRAFHGPSVHLTIGDLRMKSMDELIGWKVRWPTAAFLVVAFESEKS